MSKKVKAYAYYFPNWHVDEMNEKWHGKGWTEWNVAKCALPKFDGHYQPRIPLWGYEDESDPSVMAKKIDCASNYGISGFVFDWYWVDGKPYRNKCIENGFLGASNNEKLEFGIMLCNHDPINAHPTTKSHRSLPLGKSEITPLIFQDITDYCIEKYFSRKNYMKVDGKLYFSIFSPAKFVMDMGGFDVAKSEIEKFREKVRKAGLGEIYLSFIDNQGSQLKSLLNDQTSISVDAIGEQGSKLIKTDFDASKKTAEILSISSYNTHMMTLSYCTTFPKADFDQWVEHYEDYCNERNNAYGVDYNLCVTVGWDSSPRTVQSEVYEEVGYPFTKIITGNTPENVGKLLKKAKDMCESDSCSSKIVLIHSFNEWTEGAYLEPDEKYGYAFLEEVKKVFN